LELAPLTILLGANNSGKSSILEALFLGPNPFREAPYIPSYYAVMAVHSIHKTLESEGYAFLLYNYTADEAHIEYDGYTLKFLRSDGEILVTTNKEAGQSRQTTIRGQGTTIHNVIGVLYDSQLEPIGLERKLITDDSLLISPNLAKEGLAYMRYRWASIMNMRVCRKIAKDASQFSRDEYDDVTIEPFLGGKLAMYVYMSDGRRIRLGDLGEGIQNYIGARILFEVQRPKILLWDDIESHLNPRILVGIGEWLSDLVDQDIQVILTTHSLEAAKVIVGLNEKAEIIVASLSEGVLEAKKIKSADLEKLVEAGVDIRVAESII